MAPAALRAGREGVVGELVYRVLYSVFGLFVTALTIGLLYFGAPLSMLVFHATERASFTLVDPQERTVRITIPIEGLDDDFAWAADPEASPDTKPEEQPPEATAEGNDTPEANAQQDGSAQTPSKGDTKAPVVQGDGKGAPLGGSSGPPKVRVKGPLQEQKGGQGDKGPEQKCLDPVPEIVMLEPGVWQVKRAYVEGYTSSMERMNTLGALYYHKGPDGRNDGFKLKGMRCGSPLHQGGFRNGDVVHRINGKLVTTLLDAITVYRKLRKDELIEVELTRAGKRRYLKYHVID